MRLVKCAPLLAIAALAAGGCQAPPVPSEPPPDLQLWGARIRQYRGGRLSVHSTAARAEYHRESQVADLFGARFDLPARGATAAAVVTADHVHHDQRAQRGLAEGDLSFHSGAERAQSERAVYDGAQNLLTGQAPIEIAAPGMVARAPRWEVDVRTRSARLWGGVRVEAGP